MVKVWVGRFSFPLPNGKRPTPHRGHDHIRHAKLSGQLSVQVDRFHRS